MSKMGTTDKTDTTEKPDPWRVPIAVAQIPETGLHREIEADQAIRNAVADVGGLREVLSVQASFDVTPERGGRFHVAGRVRARIGQTCVVTLEEMETDIDEPHNHRAGTKRLSNSYTIPDRAERHGLPTWHQISRGRTRRLFSASRGLFWRLSVPRKMHTNASSRSLARWKHASPDASMFVFTVPQGIER